MQLAALDGIPICGMQWAEACDMVDLMNTLDSIERAADRYAASAGAPDGRLSAS
ncbi:hypothetical protein [Rhizobium azibense]|nr:hypothetical protein [Rhizobium azibense]